MTSHVRNRKGHTSIELATIAIIFVIVSLTCLNVGVMILGSGSNERACRDAARAAAQCKDPASALIAAQAAVAAHSQNGGYFAAPPTVLTVDYNDYGGNPPANTSPYVSVTTTCQVTIPAPIVFMGLAKFDQGTSGKMTFSKKYTFPIVATTYYPPTP